MAIVHLSYTIADLNHIVDGLKRFVGPVESDGAEQLIMSLNNLRAQCVDLIGDLEGE